MSGGPEPLMPADIRGDMKLPRELVQEAVFIADGIQVARAASGRHGKWGQEDERRQRDGRMGVVTEFCLRWAYGMPVLDRSTYPPVEDRKLADVGDNLEVRATDHVKGRLFLHEDHDDVEPNLSRNYALIVYKGQGVFRVAGWIPMKVAVDHWHDYKHWKNGVRCPERDCKGIWQDQLLFPDCLDIPDGERAYIFKLARLGA